MKERSIVGGLLGQWAGGRIEPWSYCKRAIDAAA